MRNGLNIERLFAPPAESGRWFHRTSLIAEGSGSNNPFETSVTIS